MKEVHTNREARIRSFGVGIIALATVAAAGILLRRRRLGLARLRADKHRRKVDRLYAAGL